MRGLIVIAAVLGVALVFLSATLLVRADHVAPEMQMHSGSGLAQIGTLLGSNYDEISYSNYTTFADALRNEGYVGMSSIVYRAVIYNYSSSAPETVAATVYTMSNGSAANKAESSLLSALGGAQSNSTYYTGTGGSLVIYKAYNIVADATQNSAAGFPVYQSTSIFAYGNVLATGNANGGNSMYKNASAAIAEMLSRSMLTANSTS